jgi:phosphatidate cytidylyltransferase
VLTGGQVFRVFATAFLVGGGIELYLMTRAKGQPIFLPAALMGILAFSLRKSVLFASVEQFLFPVITLVIFAIMAIEVVRAAPEHTVARAGGTLLAVFYVGFLGSYLIAITEHAAHPQMGRYGLLALLLAVWASDTFAFFMGKFLGRRLMCPSISPKKTWMGLGGALLGGAAGLLVGRTFFTPHFPSVRAAVYLGLLVGLAGQAGDLFESLIKRSCGVKDSSNIFPGHGGVLDRIDALLFAAPVYYYLLYWLK